MEDCNHDNVDGEGYCSRCGVEMSSHIDHSSSNPGDSWFPSDKRKKTRAAAIGGLTSLSEDLKRTLYLSDVTSKKGLFAAAYVNGMGEGAVDPEALGRELSLSSKAMNTSLRNATGSGSNPVTNDQGVTMTLSVGALLPQQYLDKQLDLLNKAGTNILHHKEAILILIRRGMSSYGILYNEKPERVCAGFIKYFINENKINVHNFPAILGLSIATVNTHCANATKSISLSEKE